MRLKIDRRVLKIVVVLLGVALVAAVLFVLLSRLDSRLGVVDTAEYDDADEGLVYIGDDAYAPKGKLETILLIGLDKYEEATRTQSESYNNDQQADFLLLLVLDRENQSYCALQLNRDTMTEIPVLGVRGESAGSMTGQLALAHTYGSGGSDSCRNTVDAVSNLLYGQTIDHYIAFTMDAVGTVNDLAGGVTLELMDDFSAVDPTMTQGATVTLNGDMALTYVRARSSLADSSNLHRMERQRQYVTTLAEAISAKLAADDDFLLHALEEVSPYMLSDCTVNQLSQTYERWTEYTGGEIYTMEGEAVQGEEFMEFYPDEEALRQLVVEIFYTKQA